MTEADFNIFSSNLLGSDSDGDGDVDSGSDISSAGMKLELKNYDVRVDSKGEKIFLQTGKKYNFLDLEDDYHDSAIVVSKTYNAKNKVVGVEINIRSPHIVGALKDVIIQYPDISFDGKTVTISGPPHCLFHYHKELTEHGRLFSETAKRHLLFALNYMKQTFASDLRHYKNCMQNQGSSGGLDWERLWMAYRPGDVIFCKDNHETFAGRLLRMTKYETLIWGEWTLELERIVCAGKKMEYDRCYININKYSGIKQFKDLDAYPLQYHPNQATIRKTFIKRGKRLFSLRGVHQRHYKGHARWARDPASDKEDYYDEGNYPLTKFLVRF
jgi:hypothetical protein